MAPRTVTALTSLGFRAQKEDDAHRETVLKAVTSRAQAHDLGDGVHGCTVLADASADSHAAGMFSFLRCTVCGIL